MSLQALVAFALTLSVSLPCFGQDYLRAPDNNAELLLRYPQPTHTGRVVVSGNTVLFSPDTLTVPFLDDFSQNRLNAYIDLRTDPFDTLLVAGSCLVDAGLLPVSTRYMTFPTWRYEFDVAMQEADTILNDPIILTQLDPGFCFARPLNTLTLYPEFLINIAFDSTTGDLVSGTIATGASFADTTFEVVEMVYAWASPDALWMDNRAFISQTLAIDAPSIGTASMDGLNRFGLPYKEGSGVGTADVLTSKPIDLGGRDQGDSVYMSFFYQAQGLGDRPDANDSLIVEFKDGLRGGWELLWATTGADQPQDPRFAQVMLLLRDPFNPFTDPQFFYNGFQFRFRAVGSLSGANDLWHLDYVRLAVGRSRVDTIVPDIALFEPIPTILENFTRMPWDHFDPALDLADTVAVRIRNVQGNNAFTNFGIDATELTTATSLFSFTGGGANFTPSIQVVERYIEPPMYTIPPLVQSEVIIRSQFNTQQAFGNLLTSNDTLFGDQVFADDLAYDDGSAERVYGLQGLGLKRFAYRFHVRQADTLSGLRIHFANSVESVQNLVFSLYVWKRIDVGSINPQDSVMFISSIRKPLYVDSVNGFATMIFDTLLSVSDTFYVGWSQTDIRNLEIGYDRNSDKGLDNMFIFVNGTWSGTSVAPGSPMIRPILGKFQGVPTGIGKPATEAKALRLYPNPSKERIYAEGLVGPGVAQVFSTIGRRLLHAPMGPEGLDISNLPAGMYVIHLEGEGGTLGTARFVKSR